MATPPVKPTTTHAPNTPPKPAQGSVDPREHPSASSPPHAPTPSGAVVIQNAPPLPMEHPGAESGQKPALESSEVEQAAGKVAMDMWKKRQEAEEEAGKAAVKRHTQTKQARLLIVEMRR